jgi:hypothetical protein
MKIRGVFAALFRSRFIKGNVADIDVLSNETTVLSSRGDSWHKIVHKGYLRENHDPLQVRKCMLGDAMQEE